MVVKEFISGLSKEARRHFQLIFLVFKSITLHHRAVFTSFIRKNPLHMYFICVGDKNSALQRTVQLHSVCYTSYDCICWNYLHFLIM